MKTTRLLLLLSATLITGLPAFADVVQTVEFITLGGEHDFNQTDSSTVTEDATRPFRFKVGIDGQNQDASFPTSPNQITSVPSGTMASAGVIGLSVPDSFNNQWHYTSPTFSSATALNNAFGGGSYSLLVGGHTISLNLTTGDGTNNFLYPNMPSITATNATWSNGKLVYDASSGPLTLTTNNFDTNNGGSLHLGLFISATTGQNTNYTDFNKEAFGTGLSNLSQTYSIPGEFVSGTTYQVEVEFNNLVDGPNNVSAQFGTGAQSVSFYTSRTELSLQVIPEPSTYTALAGAGALALALWHRRRRRA